MTVLPIRAVKNTIHNANHICFFGLGTLFHECYDQLVLFLGQEPDFLCDNAPEKWGLEFSGKRCISPRELGKLPEGMVIIITVKKYEDIYKQLCDMGIKDIFISCFDRGYHVLNVVQRFDDDQSKASFQESFTPQLQDKWTLVTGASRGVGYQIASAMAKLGSNIIAHSRSVSHVKELMNKCSAYGVQALPIAAELGNLNEIDAMLSNLEQKYPQIDIVFNNAAISPPFPSGVWSTSGEDYLEIFTVNTIAPVRICQKLIPSMIDRGFGRVTNITSNIQMRPDETAYACSKAALDKFVYELTPNLQDTGVMLTLIDPGWVKTDSGGPDALYEVESVIPGVLLGALLGCDFNGRRFNAQDYTGLNIKEAVRKAWLHLHHYGSGRWI